METDNPQECNCGCDPLKQILLWFLRSLFQRWDLSSGDLSSLSCFYKTSMIRDVARPTAGVNLECVLTQEIMLHFAEWISNVFLKKTSSTSGERNLVCKEDLPRLVENFQSKVTSGATILPPYVATTAYENPLGNIRLSLNVREVKAPLIKYVVCRGWVKNASDKYCHYRRYQVQIVMTCRAITEDEHYFAWEDYRKLVVAQGIAKLLSIIGHQVDERHYVTITKTVKTIKDEHNNRLLILQKDITEEQNVKRAACSSTLLSNPEVVLKTPVGTITSDSMSLYGLLNERLGSISESMKSEASLSACQTSAQNLAKATLHYDILKRPIDAPVHLQRIDGRGERHHALIIMYNYARVLSILKRFNEQVEKSEYPGLPELSEIDFNGICEKEEEIQLLQLLLEWPRIMDGSVNFISFEANLHLIPKFLLTLAKVFNKFYFEIAVLVPTNAPHNFPMMMARIYLVKAICNIFQDCFDIMQLAHTGV